MTQHPTPPLLLPRAPSVERHRLIQLTAQLVTRMLAHDAHTIVIAQEEPSDVHDPAPTSATARVCGDPVAYGQKARYGHCPSTDGAVVAPGAPVRSPHQSDICRSGRYAQTALATNGQGPRLSRDSLPLVMLLMPFACRRYSIQSPHSSGGFDHRIGHLWSPRMMSESSKTSVF